MHVEAFILTAVFNHKLLMHMFYKYNSRKSCRSIVQICI